MYLKGKYPKELFNLEGIGDQLDIGKFSKQFFQTKRTSDSSIDENSNISDNCIINYKKEASKPIYKLNSLYILWKMMRKLYNTQQANDVIERQLCGDIYIHDAYMMMQSYCFNYSCLDILNKGLPMINKINSKPPKYLYAFKSQIEQFVTIASNSTLGATGLADLLLTIPYYIKNIFKNGHDAGFYFDGWLSDDDKDKITPYLIKISQLRTELTETENELLYDDIDKLTNEINNCLNRTEPRHKEVFDYNVWRYIKETLISMIYTLNQPMRGDQSPFTNVSVYDEYFLEESMNIYIFPDESIPDKDIVNKLQDIFLESMNEELARTVFTFPVVTACFAIDDDNNIKDEIFLKSIAKHDKKFGFINIFTGKSSVLSSCCRLKSDKNNEYFNSIGGSSNKIGSLGVCTINLPRLGYKFKDDVNACYNELKTLVELTGKINNCKRKILQQKIDEGFMPLYTFDFMDLKKQYSTTGMNGLQEHLTYRGYDILNEEGQNEAIKMMDFINNIIDSMEKYYNAPHNVEQTPSEGSAPKLAKKDTLMRYNPENYLLYSNQFISLTSNADLLDRIKIQGILDDKFSGGSILHVNVDTEVSTNDISNLIKRCAKHGVRYFGINYQLNKCENGHITNGKLAKCPVCNGLITDNYHRVVGFIVNTKNFAKVRREYEYPKREFYQGI